MFFAGTDMKFLTSYKERSHISLSRLHKHLYGLPNRRTVARAAEVIKNTDKLDIILHNVGVCLLFGAFMCVITSEQRHKTSFVLNKSVVDTFVHVKYARNITLDEACNMLTDFFLLCWSYNIFSILRTV